MRGAAAALGIAIATTSAACYFTTSWDGLSGGGGEPGAKDAGPADARSDGAIAYGDGGATFPDASAFRCADHKDALFCADFDEDPYDVAFDEKDVSPLASLSATTASFVSPTRALLAVLPPRDGVTRPFASLEHALGATFTDVTLAYDAWMDAPTGDGDVFFGSLHQHGPFYIVQLCWCQGAWQLYEYADQGPGTPYFSKAHPLAFAPKTGGWTHIELHVALSGGASKATLSFDGKPAIADEPIAWGSYTPSTFHATAGLAAGDGKTSAAYAVRIDDLLVTGR